MVLSRKINPIMVKVKRELQKSPTPLTAFDLELLVFVDIRNVREYLKILHTGKEIHISGWRREISHGPWIPAYSWGQNEDAPKPARRTATESSRKHRTKEGVKEREAARKKARRALKKIPFDQSLVSLTLGIKHAS